MDKQISVSRYWSTVVRHAHIKAWRSVGGRGRLVGLVVSIIASFLIKPPSLPLSPTELLQVNAVIAAIIIVAIYIICVLWFFGREPVVIHNKKLSEIEDLQAEKSLWTEQARPKLELKYDPNHKSSEQIDRQRDDITETIFRIFVTNTSTVEMVENISVKMVGIEPNPSFTFLPADLGFMNDHEKRLNSGASLCVDVIGVRASRNHWGDIEYGLYFGFISDTLKQRQRAILRAREINSYILEIEVSGSNTASVRKQFAFNVDKSNDEPIYRLRETGDTL